MCDALLRIHSPTPQVAEATWAETFKYLADNNVVFEGILLKPSMVTPGAEHAKKATPVEVGLSHSRPVNFLPSFAPRCICSALFAGPLAPA